jgi:hypothetical protein
MARWCVHTGFGPEVFYGLTLRQRDEFTRATNKVNRGK